MSHQPNADQTSGVTMGWCGCQNAKGPGPMGAHLGSQPRNLELWKYEYIILQK
jgi:hypothetical protein